MKLSTLPRSLLNATRIAPHYLFQRFIKRNKIASPPIFIAGCGHSGTSLILAILGCHSRIYAVPYESGIALRSGNRLSRWTLRKFDALTIAAEKQRWVEKTPRHIKHIGKILRSCPSAKVLVIVRDGRDVACSIQERTGSLDEGILRWREDNLFGKEFWDHPSMHVFKYEDLIEDFDSTLRGILAFLGEESEEQLKTYYATPKYYYHARRIEKPPSAAADLGQYRNWQINQPLFDGRGKWQRLSPGELQRVHEVAGDLLAELGYVDQPEGSSVLSFPGGAKVEAADTCASRRAA
jgi:hypothetical protein